MIRNKLFAILTAVTVSAALYACGSDDDTNPTGGGGNGGHAGKTSGGSGGKTSGGSGGKPATGGSGNEAGESFGGAAGSVEQAGAGGDNGGIAGDSGLGGSGGEGGAPSAALTLSEACTAACTPAHSVTACTTTAEVCIASCTNYAHWLSDGNVEGDTAKTLTDEYLAVVRCEAEHLPNTAQYVCNADPTMNLWSPVASTVCEAVLCKWTCDDVFYAVNAAAEGAVYDRCNCL